MSFMNHWKYQKWGDLATLEYGKSLSNYDVKSGTYRVYGTNGPIGWSDKYLCEYPSVIIGRKGAYRGVNFSQKPFFVIDTAFYLKPKIEFDMKWAYYQLLTQDINSMDSGSAIPSTSRADFYQLSVNVPPLPVQKKIAAILSSLDDKIEQNTRMNKVLEEIARALFRRWFVEFEFPNAEGKPYKSAGGKMVESEMGSVPEGWGVGTLNTVVDIIGGGTPKTSVSEYWSGTIPWFSVIDAPNEGDIFVIDTEKHITQLGIENSSTRLLPVGTTIISARGTVGKCAVVGVPMTMNQSCYGIRGKEEGIDYFVYFTIRGMVSELQSKGHGSVFNTITRDTINSQMIVVPDVSVMKNYNDHVTPLLQKIQTNLTENRHLSELRDELLPKLMSGEIIIGGKNAAVI